MCMTCGCQDVPSMREQDAHGVLEARICMMYIMEEYS